MRTYGKKWMFTKRTTEKQRATRLATEWDVRLDVCEALPLEDILGRVKDAINGFLYVLVSGIERPDKQDYSGSAQYGSREEHVHLCVVLLEPKTRLDVLKLLRGPRKLSDEYCAPRNNKFSYAGWVIHHAKLDYKIPGQPAIQYEHGTCPMDPINTEWALKIQSMIDKFKPSDEVKLRYRHYTHLLRKHKLQEKVEQLQMQMEDYDVE